MTRERMFEAEMLNAQLSEIEAALRGLEEQRSVMRGVVEALGQWKTLGDGETLLVPLVPGIFTHATLSGEKELLVNVGDGVVVPKRAPDIARSIEEQLSQLAVRERELQGEFNRKLEELSKLQETFTEA
jgi:prefoldin alpha subunit